MLSLTRLAANFCFGLRPGVAHAGAAGLERVPKPALRIVCRVATAQYRLLCAICEEIQ